MIVSRRRGGLSKRKTISTEATQRISELSSYDIPTPLHSESGTDNPRNIDKGGRLKSRLIFRTHVFFLLKKRLLYFIVICCIMLSPCWMLPRKKTKASTHPIVISCQVAVDGHSILKVRKLPIHDEDRYPTKRKVEWSEEEVIAEKNLRNSRKYNRAKAEQQERDRCVLPYKWQKNLYPTCNNVHENDLTQFFNEGERKIEERLLLLDHGFFRDIWTFKPQIEGVILVLKTLRHIHELTDRNFDRHRRDALIMDHLTASNHVANIYSYCGNSIASDFARRGTVSDLIWPLSGENNNMTASEKLKLVFQVAQAVNDAHMYDENGLATVAHTDITPSQFLVFDDGSIKINDFNRCRFLMRNGKGGICPYKVTHNPGKFRSVSRTHPIFSSKSFSPLQIHSHTTCDQFQPEEYSYDNQTEKVDIYSMGNVFYSILTGLWPFEDEDDVQKVQKDITIGIRPSIEGISNDESTIAQIIQLCWKQSPNERPTATEIVSLLQTKIENHKT